ncbi:hypothetical protein M0R04_07575 [Candidatus Dojkabacteria bacterium]|jgi:hypothetical protein|nr:hypothetical protein [Candidatus Dojkabacteria bacterium]
MFNQPMQWKWVFKSDIRASAIFAVGSIDYEFNANWQGGDNMKQEHWWLSFSPVDKNDFSVTGSGNSVNVFATIVDVVGAFMCDYDPSNIYLSANEHNRMKLYLRMIKKFLPSWVTTVEDTYIIAHHKHIDSY